MTTDALLVDGPVYGFASHYVGFVDIEEGWEVVNAPRLTGLAAFRDARRRCLAKVAEMAGPDYPLKVDHVIYRRHKMTGRFEPAIEMTVFTVTTHRTIGGPA